MVTSTDPVNDFADLRQLAGADGPFLTVALPTPSDAADADHRLDIRWRNVRRDAESAGWPTQRLAELDDAMSDWEHGDAEAIVLVQAADGTSLIETMSVGVSQRSTSIDLHPRLATILDHRQRLLPHILVVTDRAGADLIAFDRGTAVATDEVDGETVHIHRGHPGGWSQRRFQQRAENTWEANARSVAEAVEAMAGRFDPALIAIVGDVRAVALLDDELDAGPDTPVVRLESGNADGIADEVVRLVDDLHARQVGDVIDRWHESVGTGSGAAGADVLALLGEGRVAELLVHDRPQSGESGDESSAGSWAAPADRAVDRAISGALTSSAGITVVPAVAGLDAGLGAIARW